jgi:hypothetical protein
MSLKLWTMPMFMASLDSLDTDLMMAVGPLWLAPWLGLMPSERGVQALRPLAEAPVISSKGVLLEMERVPVDMCE